MLSSIGGGLQNDQMLKAMITLLIIAAMLQDVLQGGGGGSQSLQSLDNGHSGALQGMMMSTSSFSLQYTSITFNTTAITGTNNLLGGGGLGLGSQLDIAG